MEHAKEVKNQNQQKQESWMLIKTYTRNKTQKICFARENFQELFHLRVGKFYSADKYTDVKIVCQDQIFKCHRLVLAASCKHFDRVFYRESNIEEVLLPNIDVETLEQILAYAYKGEVEISDLNVYNLLCASKMFGLNFIGDCCVQYLMEYGIPLTYALKLFTFACQTQKNCLIPALSEFLMGNLDILSRNCDFSKMSFNELITWLQNCPPVPSTTGNLMLEILFQWVGYLDCTSQDKKISFSKLTQAMKFEHTLPAPIAEYFDQNFINEEDVAALCLDTGRSVEIIDESDSAGLRLDAGKNVEVINESDASSCLEAENGAEIVNESDFERLHLDAGNSEEIVGESDIKGSCLDAGRDVENPRPTLCVYVRNTPEDAPTTQSLTYLVKMLEYNKDVDWHVSHLTDPHNIEYLKTVIFDNRQYCLKSQRQNKTFRICSPVDLSSDSSLLTLPPSLNSPYPEILCCDMNNMYLYDYSLDQEGFEQLYVYSKELDKWSPISFNGKQKVNFPAVTSDLSCLYLIGGFRNRSQLVMPHYMQSYDHRAGKWQQLPQSRLDHHHFDDACIYNGKIYVCTSPRNWNLIDNVIEIYDVVAGKWDAIKTTDDCCDYGPDRLFLFNSKLYAFYTYIQSSICVSMYDSILQKWSFSSNIVPAIESQVPSLKNDEWSVLSTIFS